MTSNFWEELKEAGARVAKEQIGRAFSNLNQAQKDEVVRLTGEYVTAVLVTCIPPKKTE